MEKTDRIAAARTFVRSCNVLLKQAALYGLKHSRSAAQLNLTWKELRKALADGSKLILCASADRILLDGAPLGSGTAERSLAAFLVAAGIGRIDFDPRITIEEFTTFVQICSTGKAVDVLTKLKPELGKTIGNIRIVEFRILDTSALAEAPAGPGGPGPGTGTGGGEFSGSGLDLGVLLSDPHKLLQLIDAIPSALPAAASGTGTSQNTGGGGGGGFQEGEGGGGFHKGGGGGGGFQEGEGGGGGFQKGGGGGGGFQEGEGGGVGFQKGGSGGGGFQKGEGGGGFQKGGSGGGGSQKGEGGGGFQEGEVVGVIQWLTRFAGAENGAPGPEPGKHTSNLQQAIQKILPAKPTPEMRGALLLQLAEHVALRAVSDKYKRQGLNVTAIQQMLDRMRGEIDNLRKVLHLREEELGRAGLPVESNADILDHKFWKDVPEDSKRKVLLSPDAWVLPPVIIRSFVQPLLAARAEVELASAVMQNYCRFLDGDDREARTKTASNIGKLADLFSRVRYLRNVVECVGENLVGDTAGELAPALTESFVLLGQEAVAAGDYCALDEWLGLLGELEQRDTALAASIRTRVTVDERVPEMVRIATEPPQPPEGLIEVLKRMPDPAARYIAERFAACSTREEGIRLARVLSVLGPVSIAPLREMLYRGSPADAIAALGILSMLDPDFLRPQLSARLAKWTRAQQDAALRQISAAGTPERGSLLLDLIDYLDPFVLSLAIDEIGMAGSVSASKLMHLARGLGRARGLPYLRVKAIEALGRLGEKSAAPLLTQFLTERAMLTWQQPREIRVVAAQSLQRIDPDAARRILPASGLTDRELNVGPATEVNPTWIRQRKYPRVGVENKLVGSLALPGGASSMKILDISLGGGFGNTVRDPQGQTEAALDLYIGLRKLPTQVFIRRTRPHEVCFEFVDISLDDRSRLREFLAEKLGGDVRRAQSKDIVRDRKRPCGECQEAGNY